MKIRHQILLACLVLAIGYLAYSFMQFRSEMLKVYDVADIYTLGNVQGDLMVVDFNRPACPKCHTLHPIILEAVKKDGNIRYIPRILMSQDAWLDTISMSVYAAAHQGKFAEMYDLVYREWPIKDKKELLAHAENIGLDTEQLSRDITRPEVRQALEDNQMFFESWNLGMTPSVLIGDSQIYRPINDSPSVPALLDAFDAAR